MELTDRQARKLAKILDDVFVTFACDGMLGRSSKSMFEDFTFDDGTPFGIREE